MTEPVSFHWIPNILAPVVVGIVVLLGQFFINPITARKTKHEETLLQKRYEASERAADVLYKLMASFAWTGPGSIPGRVPEVEAPSELEINQAFVRLAIYGTSGDIATKYQKLVGNPQGLSAADVGAFVAQLRREMGVKEPGVSAEDFHYTQQLRGTPPEIEKARNALKGH
jgi:hypothetical protein